MNIQLNNCCLNSLIFVLALDILVLQAQPPPDDRVYDIYQKFKHALNLLVRYCTRIVCKALYKDFKFEKTHLQFEKRQLKYITVINLEFRHMVCVNSA